MEKAVKQLPGVIEVELLFSTGKLKIKRKLNSGDDKDLFKQISRLGYGIQSVEANGNAGADGKFEYCGVNNSRILEDKRKRFIPGLLEKNHYLLSTIMAGLIFLAGLITVLLNAAPFVTHSIYVVGILVGAYWPARAAWATLVNLRELDMNALMVMAVVGAIAIGEFEEGLAVVFLFSLGNCLQVYTFDRTRNSLRQLMEMSPREGLVRREGQEKLIPVTQIQIGDTVIVRPGDIIPVDGSVSNGSSSVNQAPITGESVPVYKKLGDEVFAGSLNGNGALEIEVLKLHQDTTLNRIIIMVEEAQGQKAPSQELIDRFSRCYTPMVMGGAVLVATIPPLLLGQPFDKCLYEGLAMLLVACPCALVISTPVSIVAAIGNAARNGVLIKGGNYLEELGKVSVVAFDKTGTLTEGRPEITEIIPIGEFSDGYILAIAAAIERRSEHPLGSAIIQHSHQRGIPLSDADGFLAVPGKGAQAIIDGQEYYLGNAALLQEKGISLSKVEPVLSQLQEEGKSVALLADGKNILGIIAVADVIRRNSQETISTLHKMGIEKSIMLTGDNRRVAASIAHKLKIDSFKADLLPENKVDAIKDLIVQHQRVVMVGDGINDAPALALASVGIVMGTAGTETALETADIALMADDLSKIPFAVFLGRKTVAIIKQNITLSLLIKGIILLMVIPGMLTMWMAVLGDMGTSLLVTLNGMRLLRAKNR